MGDYSTREERKNTYGVQENPQGASYYDQALLLKSVGNYNNLSQQNAKWPRAFRKEVWVTPRGIDQDLLGCSLKAKEYRMGSGRRWF